MAGGKCPAAERQPPAAGHLGGPQQQQSPQGPPPSLQANPQFFVDQKRGELHELRLLLRQLPTERDPTRQREALKKVIAYMTVGMDVSRLFSEVVMLSSTTDMVLKKMVYLYLTNYAETNPSLAILAVNTFQKDCGDHDPRLRGLAIRSLCSLRVLDMVEYIEPALRRGLQDPQPYVRRVCVMGLIKLWQLLQQRGEQTAAAAEAAAAPAAAAGESQDTSLYTHQGIVAALTRALYDSDPQQVTINAIQGLNEVNAAAGGVLVTQELITNLLNRIKQFNECGQCVVLNLLITYQAKTEQETFDILNILDDRLKSSSAAVVLSCARCFLSLAKNTKSLYEQALARLAPPLLTLVATSCPELAYTVLQHILLILETPGNEAFARSLEGEYQQFFCRYSDPSYIKSVKLEILTAIATEVNASQILQELKDCVSDADMSVGRLIIRSMGRIALQVTSSVADVIDSVLSLLDHEIDFVMSACFGVLRDILRKHREVIDRVAPAVEACGLKVSGADLSSVLWIIGEFGTSIPGAPYLLEVVADRFGEEEPVVQLELLTACAKLFFASPGEMQPILGSVLKQAKHVLNFDVRDKALFIYRLMKADINHAKTVFSTPLPPIDAVRTAASLEASISLFKEFNSLSVVYRQPACSFLCVEPLPFCGHASQEQQQQEGALLLSSSQQGLPLDGLDGGCLGGAEAEPPQMASPQTDPQRFRPAPAHTCMHACVRCSGCRLQPREALSAADFQMLWEEALPTRKTIALSASPCKEGFAEEVEAAAASIHISTMASGVLEGGLLKMFLYATDYNSVVYLSEVVFNPSPPELNLQVKTAPQGDSHKAVAFIDLLVQLLLSKQLIQTR
ncbi:hypothetical protein Esti_004044 [Eimeria stiedai]